jgi:hypothetical protein
MMKNILWLLLLAPLWNLHGQNNSTLSRLEKTYKGYLTACDKGNGEKAVSYLDSNSIVFFELMLHHLWYADSMALEKLSMSERWSVLFVRHLVSKERIIAFTPHSLAVCVLGETGSLGSYVREGYNLGDLRIEGNKAFAKLVFQDKTIDPEFEFTNEHGHWKISLIPFMRDAESSIPRNFNKKGNYSEKALHLWLLESFSDKPVEPKIWEPIK